MTAAKIKCILIGDSSVGKTSILTRLRFDTFRASNTETIGVDFCSIPLPTSTGQGQHIDLCIWDTAGSEKYRSLFTRYYKGSHVVLCVCDLHNNLTWKSLSSVWLSTVYSEVEKETSIILVVNKCDDESTDTMNRCKEFESFLNLSMDSGVISVHHVVYSSAKTRRGMNKLKGVLTQEASKQLQTQVSRNECDESPQVTVLLTNEGKGCICQC